MSEPRKTGRPKAKIDWSRVDQMLKEQCTGVEIAAVFGIHTDTLYDACEREHNTTFSAYAQQKRAIGVQFARSVFYKSAWEDKPYKGQDIKQIFWMKNYGDMTDKTEVKQSIDATVKQAVIEMPSNQSGPGDKNTLPKPWETGA